MCLAVPMRVVSIDGDNAVCDYHGVRREVGLGLLQEEGVEVGDCVLIHVGYAIAKVAEDEAKASWALFDELSHA